MTLSPEETKRNKSGRGGRLYSGVPGLPIKIMENWLEILVPLIFAILYFLGNLMSGKSDEKRSPSELHRQPGNDNADAAERQRRIQEEIRRKILERRRAAEGVSPTGAAPESEALRERRRTVEALRSPRRQIKERQKETLEIPHETPPFMSPTHEGETLAPEGGFSWDTSDNVYQQGIEARLRRIEETKHRAEALQHRAEMANRKVAGCSERRPSGLHRGLFSAPVRESLKDPAAARMAFVYAEVLEPPVSLRQPGGNLKGLMS